MKILRYGVCGAVLPDMNAKVGATKAKIRPPERILELLVVTGSSGYLR